MTTAHQRRAYPWFKETPATFLSDRAFKALSWSEKGLFTALRWEYWVNGALPSDAGLLDSILGAEPGMCARFIAKAKGHFLEEIEGSLHFPDLLHQRRKQGEDSKDKSEYGRKGGKESAARRAKRAAEAANEADASAPAQAGAQALYSDSSSPSNSHSTSGLQEGAHMKAIDDFRREYEQAESRYPLGGSYRVAA